MKQRLTEWFEQVDRYHEKQFTNIFRQTVFLCDWLETKVSFNNPLNIIDIACGQGANMAYMSERYANCNFSGIEINQSIVDKGNQYFQESDIKNCRIFKEDLYALPDNYVGKYDGIVSFQALSFLPEYREALIQFAKINAEWIVLSSLFYDGHVDCCIQTKDYTRPVGNKTYRESFYNVYSINRIRELLKKYNYSEFDYIPFTIDIDIKPKKTKGMMSYTKKLETGERITISGPLLLPWYFVFARKTSL